VTQTLIIIIMPLSPVTTSIGPARLLSLSLNLVTLYLNFPRSLYIVSKLTDNVIQSRGTVFHSHVTALSLLALSLCLLTVSFGLAFSFIL
jgi:hypothetical protein